MSKQEDNNGEFGQAWKDALEGASISPPAGVWSEIDKSLTQTQLVVIQKQAAIYKWVAAAAIIVASSIGVLAVSYNYRSIRDFFKFDKPTTVAVVDSTLDSPGDGVNYSGFSILRIQNLTQETIGDHQSTVQSTVALLDEQESNVEASQSKLNVISPSGVGTTSASKIASRTPLSVPVIRSLPADVVNISRISLADLLPDFVDNILPGENHRIEKREIFSFDKHEQKTPLLTENQIDVSSFGVNKVWPNNIKKSILNGASTSRFWCGVDITSGYFNPNYSQGTTITSQELLAKDVGSRQPVPELSENIRGGASYSVGINFGMLLKDKWSLEVGGKYSLLGARTFTNLILESDGFNDAVAYSSEISGLETVANLVESELTKLSVDDIQINNTFQFISFPVQVGYKLLDKRFNVTLNGGLAANLYLGNSLRGRKDFSSFDLEPGRRSPYRSLTLAGVAGLELGYWVHRRVNVSFEPSFQKNLQSLTKDDSGFVANPSGIGVEIGFKYDF